jgi:hypothetical protein
MVRADFENAAHACRKLEVISSIDADDAASVLTLYAADFIVIMLLLALWRFQTKEVC